MSKPWIVIAPSREALDAAISRGEVTGDNIALVAKSEEVEIGGASLPIIDLSRPSDDNHVVDFAIDLTGVPEATPEEFTYRPSAGRKSIRDKSAVIRGIKGNSVVWEQKLQAILKREDFEGATTYYDYDTNECVVQNISRTSNYSIGSTRWQIKPDYYTVPNHVYLLLSDKDYVGVGVYSYSSDFQNVNTIKAHTGNDILYFRIDRTFDWVNVCPIGSEIRFRMMLFDLTVMFGAGNEPTTVDEFYARIPERVDLTAYNAGELISMNVYAIETNGFNQWDEEWEVGEINENTGENADVTYRIRSKNFIPIIGGETYNFHCASNGKTLYFSVACYDENKKFIGAVKNGIYPSTSATSANYHNPWTFEKDVAYIRFATAPLYGTTYKNDICINLSHTGVRNGEYEPYWKSIKDLSVIKKYFHDGMRSAGSAYDEIVFDKSREKWVAIKRIGSVDLGSLSWNYTSTEGQQRYVSYGLQGIINVPNSNGDVANTRTTRYLATYFNGMWDNTLDKTLAVHTNGAVAIKDLSYNDVTTFKNSLQGVMLYYELAEPIVTEIDDVVDFAYAIDDFGTERILSDGASAPFKADIVYQFNAEGRIRDNSRNIDSLEERIQTLYQGEDTTGSIANTIKRNTISFDKLTDVSNADGLIKGRDTKAYIDTAIKNATPYDIDANKNVSFPEKVVARSFEDSDGNAVMLVKDIPTEVATAVPREVVGNEQPARILPNRLYDWTGQTSLNLILPPLASGDNTHYNKWMVLLTVPTSNDLTIPFEVLWKNGVAPTWDTWCICEMIFFKDAGGNITCGEWRIYKYN